MLWNSYLRYAVWSKSELQLPTITFNRNLAKNNLVSVLHGKRFSLLSNYTRACDCICVAKTGFTWFSMKVHLASAPYLFASCSYIPALFMIRISLLLALVKRVSGKIRKITILIKKQYLSIYLSQKLCSSRNAISAPQTIRLIYNRILTRANKEN